MADVGHVLDLIDHALEDYVSPDAMRWAPERPEYAVGGWMGLDNRFDYASLFQPGEEEIDAAWWLAHADQARRVTITVPPQPLVSPGSRVTVRRHGDVIAQGVVNEEGVIILDGTGTWYQNSGAPLDTEGDRT